MPLTLKVFATNSSRAVLDELVPQFERASGDKVEVSYDPAKVMLRRIAGGESADVAILGSAALDELIKQEKIAPGSRRLFARCGVGVAVRAGAAKPDIGTVDALKRALLAAKSVAYTQEGASGMHFSGLIEKWGIAAQIEAKAVRQPGGLIGEQVAAGRAEIAIQQVPELLAVRGINLVGPLPAEIQLISVSAIGVFSATKEPNAANAFAEFLCTPATARVLKAKGHEPANL
jgi:molybdate transport system substrate-binding protein